MNREHLENSINTLVDDLKPVSPVPSRHKLIGVWIPFSFLAAFSGVLLTGPLRENFWSQLTSQPIFALEFLFGLAIGPTASYWAFKLIVAGELPNRSTKVYIGHAMLMVFLLWMIFTITSPTLEPSLLGKRPHCFVESLGLALLPLVSLLYLLEKGATMRPKVTGFLAGIAAATSGAIAMHIACMYEPKHILIYHISTVFITGFIGSACCTILKRKA